MNKCRNVNIYDVSSVPFIYIKIIPRNLITRSIYFEDHETLIKKMYMNMYFQRTAKEMYTLAF